MLYQLVYNIRSHFNELILAWSACDDTSIKMHFDLIALVSTYKNRKQVVKLSKQEVQKIKKIDIGKMKYKGDFTLDETSTLRQTIS